MAKQGKQLGHARNSARLARTRKESNPFEILLSESERRTTQPQLPLDTATLRGGERNDSFGHDATDRPALKMPTSSLDETDPVQQTTGNLLPPGENTPEHAPENAPGNLSTTSNSNDHSQLLEELREDSDTLPRCEERPVWQFQESNSPQKSARFSTPVTATTHLPSTTSFVPRLAPIGSKRAARFLAYPADAQNVAAYAARRAPLNLYAVPPLPRTSPPATMSSHVPRGMVPATGSNSSLLMRPPIPVNPSPLATAYADSRSMGTGLESNSSPLPTALSGPRRFGIALTMPARTSKFLGGIIPLGKPKCPRSAQAAPGEPIDFLAMGHAKDCWCDARRNKTKQDNDNLHVTTGSPEGVAPLQDGQSSGPTADSPVDILPVHHGELSAAATPTTPITPAHSDADFENLSSAVSAMSSDFEMVPLRSRQSTQATTPPAGSDFDMVSPYGDDDDLDADLSPIGTPILVSVDGNVSEPRTAQGAVVLPPAVPPVVLPPTDPPVSEAELTKEEQS